MQLFDWPWMVAAAVVIAIGMAWMVRASFQRRMGRVS
jgi:hypothetical protein